MTPAPFRAAWWLKGCHGQTTWRRLVGAAPLLRFQRERVWTPDGDFLDLDWVGESRSGGNRRPLVIVLHGLEGSSRAKYVRGVLGEAMARNWSGLAVNFRSCSGEINRVPRFYHSGETSDLGWLMSMLIGRFPGRSMALVGFSLGGNVVLKWLGEQSDEVPEQVRAAVAVSVPFDLGVAAHRLDRGGGRLYGRLFLRTLKRKALQKASQFPGLIDTDVVEALSSFVGFDEHVTAPLHGFTGATDYWARSNCTEGLTRIRRATLLISAADDPFVPSPFWPRAELARSSWVESDFTDHGGHVGFVQGAWPWTASYWVDQRVMEFLDTVRFKEGF